MATRLTPKEIEQKAKEILNQHGLYSLPIDPVVLANKFDITVHNAEFVDDSWAASISKRGSSTSIFVEQSDTLPRKRFSVAHELGHYFLHHLPENGEFADKQADMFRERTPSENTSNEDRYREIEANRFAAALLMPAELVRKQWEKKQNVSWMAKTFKVSNEAMGYRLEALHIL